MDFNPKPTSAAKTQRFVTNDAAWRQALTKHRNVLLEVNFSVEFGGFFWGGLLKRYRCFFGVRQKIQGLVVTLKTEKRCEKINGRV